VKREAVKTGTAGATAAEPEVERLASLRQAGAERHRQLVAETEMTLAFLRGNQWVEFASWETGLQPVANEADEIRVTDNRMLPAFRRWLYYHFQERPQIVAFEGGHELADAESAAVASALCDAWQANNGWEQARKEAVGWVGVCGVGYVMPVWRAARTPKRRQRRKYVDAGQPTADGRISFLRAEEETVYDSDLAFEALCPLTTYLFPLTARKWSEVERVMTVHVQSAAWIRANVAPELDVTQMTPVQDEDLEQAALERINNLVSPQFGYATLPESEGDERYLVMQLFERPTKERPNGRYLVAAGGVLAVDAELPYVAAARAVDPGDVYNLTLGIVPHFAMDFPGALVPPSPMGALRDAQIRLNDLLTDEARNRKTVGRTKLLYEEGTLDEARWTGEHGERIPLKPGAGFAPQMVQGLPLAGIGQEIERSFLALDEQTGQTAVLRGQNAPQVRAAFHYDIMREEALTLTAADISQAERAFELTARLALGMAKERYTPERVVQIVGRDRTGYALTFERAQIPLDVRLKTGSMLPRNHALREAKIIEMAAQGVFNDPKTGRPDSRMVVDMLELGTLNRSVTAEKRAINRAGEEFVLMVRYGEPVLPQEWEDHALHIEEHTRDMARPEFYDAPEAKRALFLQHLREHNELEIERLAPEANRPLDPVPGLLSPGNIGGEGGAGASLPPELAQLAEPRGQAA